MKQEIDLFEQIKNIAREFDKTNQNKKSKDAMFLYVPEGDYYLAASTDAARLGAIMSKMKFRDSDMITVRAKGYTPRLQNGTEIGKVKIDV